MGGKGYNNQVLLKKRRVLIYGMYVCLYINVYGFCILRVQFGVISQARLFQFRRVDRFLWGGGLAISSPNSIYDVIECNVRIARAECCRTALVKTRTGSTPEVVNYQCTTRS